VKPDTPEDEWPHCKICGEKCFSNPGSECQECNEYPLCTWCYFKKNCCRDKIIAKREWSEDKQLPKPVMNLKERLQGTTNTSTEEAK